MYEYITKPFISLFNFLKDNWPFKAKTMYCGFQNMWRHKMFGSDKNEIGNILWSSYTVHEAI